MTLPPLPPLPAEQTPTHCSDGFKYGHSDATLQAYAEQYGRLCAEAERAESFTEEQLGAACAQVGIPDSLCERLTIAIQAIRARGQR